MPDNLHIVEANSAPLRRQFVRLSADIYRHDPQWVTPLEFERLRFIDPRVHPFYQHGAATTWLALRGKQVVGRILVSDDPHYNRKYGTNTGCFGMFEAPPDQEVADALLDRAAGWLQARGRSSMMGPIDYSTNYMCGLLVDGFDTPPRVMMNHNPPYYSQLLERWGLRKEKDLYSWWFPRELNLKQKWERVADRLQTRTQVKIRPVNLRDFWNDAQRMKEIFTLSFANHWGFVEMSDHEFQHMACELKPLLIPGLLLFAEHRDEVVGVSMTLPDLNEAIRPIGGRLTNFGLPIGLVRMLYNLRRSKVGRMLLIGVNPQYRRRGVLERLILQTFEYGTKVANFSAAELGWTLEDNDQINGPIAATGACRYKTYRIYSKEFGTAAHSFGGPEPGNLSSKRSADYLTSTTST